MRTTVPLLLLNRLILSIETLNLLRYLILLLHKLLIIVMIPVHIKK